MFKNALFSLLFFCFSTSVFAMAEVWDSTHELVQLVLEKDTRPEVLKAALKKYTSIKKIDKIMAAAHPELRRLANDYKVSQSLYIKNINLAHIAVLKDCPGNLRTLDSLVKFESPYFSAVPDFVEALLVRIRT